VQETVVDIATTWGTAAYAPAAIRLRLIGEFELVVNGRRLIIPRKAERVLAYLAMVDRPVARTRLAGILWMDWSDQQAAKALRTALWLLRRVAPSLVTTSGDRLQLAADVQVDAAELCTLARQLIHDPHPAALERVSLLIDGRELLPDWDDHWVVMDRDRYRHLRIEALERAAAALLDQRRTGDALVAALAAIQSEPLRESAWRLLVQIHLAQANVAEAIRSYREYRALLQREFGIEPSTVMERLLEDCGTSAVATDAHRAGPRVRSGVST
jgi:DNA-binding SARP family transcriptional activator